MRNIIIISILLFVGQLAIQAQDLIIRKDGTEVQAKVLEVSSHIIIYTRFDNPDGPEYRENKNLILKIKYANGTEDVFVKNRSDNTYLQVGEKRKSKVRYSGLVEVAPYIGPNFVDNTDQWINNPKQNYPNDIASGVSVTTTHGIQIKDRYFVGMGIGLNVEFASNDESDVYIPLYMTFRYNLSSAAARPFISASLGAQFGVSGTSYHYDNNYSYGHSYIGLWSNAMFGYRFKNKLYIAAGVTIQTSEDYDFWDNRYNEWVSSRNRSIYETVGLMLGFGIQF